MNWAARPRRFFQHLLREIDAVGLEPARLIEQARAVGADSYLSMGGGFSAWYPSDITAQPRNPHLERDVLGETLEAARSADMRVLVRMDISKVRIEVARHHRDSLVRRPDGSVATMWAMPQICATSPFWRDVNLAILTEILSRYAVDGLFYNFFHIPRCHCSRCEMLVREETGAGVPEIGVRTPAYERWRQRTLAAYAREVRDFIRSRQPDALFIPYHHLRDGWDYRAMAAVSGMISAQVSNPIVPNPVDPQPMWAHWSADEVLRARAVKPEAAPLLTQTTSAFFASRQTAIPAGRLVWNMAQGAAHGGHTCPAHSGLLGDGDPRAVSALRTIGRRLSRHASWYEGLSTTARIAIVRSDDSIAWGADGGRLAGDPAGRGHVAEYRGMFKLVTNLRHPLSVLSTDGLSVEELSRFAAVVVPGVSCLSDADLKAFGRYLEEGGTLIVTGEAPIADEDGRLRRVLPPWLPASAGAPRAVAGAYLAVRDRTRIGTPWMGVEGLFWMVAEQDGDDVDLRLIGPFENNAPEFTVVQGPGEAPGLIRRSHGAGRLIRLPWQVGALYDRFHPGDYRAVLADELQAAVGPPPVATDAPGAVEIILYAHPRGHLLHLINGAASNGDSVTNVVPLAGFTVVLGFEADAAFDLGEDGETTVDLVRGANGRQRLTIDRLDSFKAIALTRTCKRGTDTQVGHGHL